MTVEKTEQENKKAALPLVRTPAEQQAIEKQAQRAARAAEKKALEDNAKRLAQIVNLTIAGYTLAEIGLQIGATADEVDRMLAADAQRYIRNQPSLRVYVRNYISGKFNEMLEANWDVAVDKNHPLKLDNQDRALRILDRMARLHGADAPTQTEMKVEGAPEAVERLVQALSTAQGLGYDASIFDVVDGEVVHEAVVQSHDAEVVSGNRVSLPEPGEEL